MHILKDQWEVRPIPHSQAKDFILENHYAKRCANTSVSRCGLFFKGDNKTLHGVAMWMPPVPGAGKAVAQDHRIVLGLTRFCLVKDRPENAGSFLLSSSVELLDKDKYRVLITYADTATNHDGGLYYASNWAWHGKTKRARIYIDPTTGEMVSKKAGPVNRSHKQMLELGYEAHWSEGKHRFVMPNSRRQRGKILKAPPLVNIGTKVRVEPSPEIITALESGIPMDNPPKLIFTADGRVVNSFNTQHPS